MRIAVIGSEGVGLVSAACFAELGHHVICVDDDENRVAALNNGKVLIHEDYLAELLARHVGSNLTFSSSLTAAVRECIVIVMALETPMSPAGTRTAAGPTAARAKGCSSPSRSRRR